MFIVKILLKCVFPKVGFLKFQNRFNRSIFISEEEGKYHSTQNCMHYNATEPDFLKKIVDNYYIYCSQF